MNKPFAAAQILLPREGTDMERWAALACDQHTSEPEYWDKAEEIAKGVPSALHITLPEIYLESGGVDARIAAIRTEMEDYCKNVLTRTVQGFVYVERTTQSGVRQGLVGAVDLEQYSYEKGTFPLVRPSERTVVERIPPRIAVRRGAPVETPHIMMLIDDPAKTVIEPFAAKKAQLEALYDTPLMLDGGHIAGWAVTDADEIARVENAVMNKGTKEQFEAQYPEAAGRAPLAVIVGDGNHSLATAKAHWEEVKRTLTPGQQETHPARWCLAELVNIHSEAILIEPVHRVVFGTDENTLCDAFTGWLLEKGCGMCAPELAGQMLYLTDGKEDHPVCWNNAKYPLCVGTLDAFLTEYAAAHPEIRVDYIHGKDSVHALAQKGAVGILLPDFEKSDLFRGVVLGGVLPKKTFSMGHAEEKRYYLECRKITANAL